MSQLVKLESLSCSHSRDDNRIPERHQAGARGWSLPTHLLEPAGELIELPFAHERGGFVPGGCLRRNLRQRRFLIHDGDGAVKFEILGPFGKASLN